MTDLLTVLPQLPTAPFSNLLPSLERNCITVADLLTLDAVDIAKRAQLPGREVRRLIHAVLDALHVRLGPSSTWQGTDEANSEDGSVIVQHGRAGLNAEDHQTTSTLRSNGLELSTRWGTISCLDEDLDDALGGGFPTGYLSEVTGESGAGKTHLLLTLLLAVQLPKPHGISRNAIFISTEAALSTTRLNQLLATHPRFKDQTTSTSAPSLDRILSIKTSDLESQDHILRYQLPIAIRRHNIGLVVIDSITANFRAEFERRGNDGPTTGGGGENGPAAMARRSAQLIETAAILRNLAREHNITVVVANQVADRFSHTAIPPASASALSQPPAPNGSPQLAPASSPMDPDAESDGHNAMTLDHQQRWFTGWGDEVPHRMGTAGMKTPSLGLVWTNQLACRVALTRRLVRNSGREGGGMRWQRHLKVVFAPWCADAADSKGVEFDISNEGLKSANQPGEKPD